MPGSRLIPSAVNVFLQWAERKMKPPTVQYYRHFLYRFAETFSDRQLSSVTRLDVELWADAHHPLQAVSRFFAWTVDVAQWLPVSPCRKLPIPPVGRRRRTLSRKERATLRRTAQRPLRDALLCMEVTGCRPGEMRAVRWEDIHVLGSRAWTPADLIDGKCYFVLTSFKCKDRRANPDTPRLIPVGPRLGKLLARFVTRDRILSGEIFRMSCGRAWTPNGFRCAFRRLRTKLAENGRVDVAGLVPYLLRHTKATDLCRSGANARLVADYLGHVGMDMLSVYVHPNVIDLMELDKDWRKRGPAAM